MRVTKAYYDRPRQVSTRTSEGRRNLGELTPFRVAIRLSLRQGCKSRSRSVIYQTSATGGDS
jgi:hypothetical protein